MTINDLQVLSAERVTELTQLGQPHLLRLADRGEFPKPVRTSGKRRVWLEAEVVEWLKGKVAERDRAATAA